MNPDSGYRRCAIASVTASIQQVNRVCSRFGVSVSPKEVQAMGKSFLHSCLKAVVVAVSGSDGVAVVLAEIREWKPALGCGNCSGPSSAIRTGSVCKLGTSGQ